MESAENDNLLHKLETGEKAFNFANIQVDRIFEELASETVESQNEKILKVMSCLVRRLGRINRSPDPMRFMEKELYYLEMVAHIDQSLDAIISNENFIDDCLYL